jgi:hypothetical protein
MIRLTLRIADIVARRIIIEAGEAEWVVEWLGAS